MCAQHSPRQCANPPLPLAGANRGETAAHQGVVHHGGITAGGDEKLSHLFVVGTPPIEIANWCSRRLVEEPLWNFGVAACRTVRADISPLKRVRDALCMWERQLESKPRSAIGSGKKASEHHAITRRNSRSCGYLGKPRESTLRWPSSGRNTWKDEPLIISLWALIILASKSTCHGLCSSRPANS